MSRQWHVRSTACSDQARRRGAVEKVAQQSWMAWTMRRTTAAQTAHCKRTALKYESIMMARLSSLMSAMPVSVMYIGMPYLLDLNPGGSACMHAWDIGLAACTHGRSAWQHARMGDRPGSMHAWEIDSSPLDRVVEPLGVDGIEHVGHDLALQVAGSLQTQRRLQPVRQGR